MENPNTWTDIHRTIADAIEQHTVDRFQGRFGKSLAGTIYDALKEKGYIAVPPTPEVAAQK